MVRVGWEDSLGDHHPAALPLHHPRIAATAAHVPPPFSFTTLSHSLPSGSPALIACLQTAPLPVPPSAPRLAPPKRVAEVERSCCGTREEEGK